MISKEYAVRIVSSHHDLCNAKTGAQKSTNVTNQPHMSLDQKAPNEFTALTRYDVISGCRHAHILRAPSGTKTH